VAIGVVVFVGVIFFGRPLVEGRLTAARNLDKATAMIADSDSQLAVIDSAVRASSATGDPGKGAQTIALVSATRSTLEDASRLSQDGYNRLTSDEQERAAIVQATAEARLEALASAATVLSAEGQALTRALQEYERAVEKVRSADAALVKL
jgi:hypothetical protein